MPSPSTEDKNGKHEREDHPPPEAQYAKQERPRASADVASEYPLDDRTDETRLEHHARIDGQPVDIARIVLRSCAPLGTQIARRRVGEPIAFIARALIVPKKFSDAVIEGDYPPFHTGIVSIDAEGVVVKVRRRRPNTDQRVREKIAVSAEFAPVVEFVVGPEGVKFPRRGILPVRIKEPYLPDGRQLFEIVGRVVIPDVSLHRVSGQRAPSIRAGECDWDAQFVRQEVILDKLILAICRWRGTRELGNLHSVVA